MLMLCFISFVNHQYFSPIGLLPCRCRK